MGAPHRRSLRFRCLSIAICLAGLQSSLWAQSTDLPPPRGVQGLGPILFEEWIDPSLWGNTRFGQSVAISGNTALVGIPGYQTGIGRVGIFSRDDTGLWQRVGSIENPSGDGSFGDDVRLTRDFAFVSFSSESAFGNYVYRRTKHGEFRLVRSISRSFSIDEATGRLFTTSQAVDGSTIVKLSDLDKHGRLHVAERFTIPSDLTVDELRRAAIWDDIYVLTNPGDNDFQGAAYVFEKRHGRWRLQQKLIAADGNAQDLFGSNVAVYGETIVIGAVNADRPKTGTDCLEDDSGAVYIFKRRHGMWIEDQKLDPVVSSTNCVPNFGDRLFFSGKVLLVMDRLDSIWETFIGWHVFERQSGQYQPVAYRLDVIDRSSVSYDLQGSTFIRGIPTEGCCNETGTVGIWDLTP
jgi:hypothetical protein